MSWTPGHHVGLCYLSVLQQNIAYIVVIKGDLVQLLL